MTDSKDNTPADAQKQVPSEFKIDIDPKVGESLQGGLDALGNVFGGLIGAIRDAVGPELMRNMEVAGWVGQVATCLEQIAASLKEDGNVSAEVSGQLSFFVDQFDSSLEGSKLESQQVALKQYLLNAQQAVENADRDAVSAVAQAAGYFKAAAASCVPIQPNENSTT